MEKRAQAPLDLAPPHEGSEDDPLLDHRERYARALDLQKTAHENIKFADAKATGLVVINSGIIAALWNVIHPDRWVALAICGALSVGVGLAASVAWPRGRKSRDRGAGYVDPTRIALYPNAEAFTKAVDGASGRQLVVQAETFLFDRSRIDQEKYRRLVHAKLVSYVAWVAAALTVVLPVLREVATIP